MQTGFDVVERSNFDKRGITGEVTRYAQDTVMVYPYFKLISPVERHKLPVLKGMIDATQILLSSKEKSGEITEQLDAIQTIAVYIEQDADLTMVGKIQPRQVLSFLRLFETNNVVGALDEEHIDIDRTYLYALSD